MFAVLERRHRRSPTAHFPLVRAFIVVRVDPLVKIRRQLFRSCVNFITGSDLIELIQDGLMEALADPVRLR